MGGDSVDYCDPIYDDAETAGKAYDAAMGRCCGALCCPLPTKRLRFLLRSILSIDWGAVVSAADLATANYEAETAYVETEDLLGEIEEGISNEIEGSRGAQTQRP